MKCEEFDRYLDDFMNGSLEKTLAGNMKQHLESCPECRAVKDSVAKLLEKSHKLPKEVTPPRNLWPGIRERIETQKNSRSLQTGRLSPSRNGLIPVWVAAAVVLLGVLVYWVIQNPYSRLGNDVTEVSGTTEPAFTETILAGYTSARGMLYAELEKRQDELDPETLKIVMENMRIMDQAAKQIREALEKDPGNWELERMLMASYHKEVRLLRMANDIPSGIMR